MSSKFQTSRRQFKTPPVCKKSPVGPPENPTVPAMLQLWYHARGIDTTGAIVETHQQLALVYQPASTYAWLTQIDRDGYTWFFEISHAGTPRKWFFGAFAISPSFGLFASAPQEFTPIHQQPFDSGYQQPIVTLGSGSTSFRGLL